MPKPEVEHATYARFRFLCDSLCEFRKNTMRVGGMDVWVWENSLIMREIFANLLGQSLDYFSWSLPTVGVEENGFKWMLSFCAQLLYCQCSRCFWEYVYVPSFMRWGVGVDEALLALQCSQSGVTRSYESRLPLPPLQL